MWIRISATRMVRGDWKLPRMMKQSGLEFTEAHLLRIVGELGSKKDCWERALSVVEWAYSDKDKKRNKSRFLIISSSRFPFSIVLIFYIHIYRDANWYARLGK